MYNTSDWGWYNHSFFVPYKPLRGGKVDEDNLKVIRVGKECDIKDLALEIRTNLLDNEYAIVQAMSKEAVNNAVKAIAIASRDEASKRGKNIISEGIPPSTSNLIVEWYSEMLVIKKIE